MINYWSFLSAVLAFCAPLSAFFWKVDVRLPGKGNSNSHGARPVHLIITMIKWIRTSRLSIKTLSLSLYRFFIINSTAKNN